MKKGDFSLGYVWVMMPPNDATSLNSAKVDMYSESD